MELVAERIREASSRAFREGQTLSGTKREIVIIEAGWGSSGYYSESVIGRDIPRIFPVGTHMYLNHPTTAEENDRPERNVLDLVGVVAEAPRMAGIASVAVAEIFEHWVPVIDAIAEHIGLSIRAYGTAEEGDAGGKHGQIIQTLTEGLSIDYVTLAGAGGKVGPLVESAREKVIPLIETAREKQTPEQVKEAQLSELNANLEKAGEEKFGSDEPYTYCYVEDVEIDQNWVVYRVRVSGEDARYMKVNFVRNADGDVALSGDGAEVDREISWEPSQEPTLPVPPVEEKETEMTDEEKRRLSELEESVKTLQGKVTTAEEAQKTAEDERDRTNEVLMGREARTVAQSVVEADGIKEKLPEQACKRVVENALRGKLPTGEEGKLDKDALLERAKKALKEEVDYIAETSGIGKPRGSGGDSTFSVSESENEDADTKRLEESFVEGGMSPEAAKVAAKGR